MIPPTPRSTLFPYTTLFRSQVHRIDFFCCFFLQCLAANYRFLLLETRKNLWIRSEEHTSELQSRFDVVCRLLLEKTKPNRHNNAHSNQHEVADEDVMEVIET